MRRFCTVAASGVLLLAAGPAGAQETRAALDPAEVAGRGADVVFAEQEAEHAVTTGQKLSASATGDKTL